MSYAEWAWGCMGLLFAAMLLQHATGEVPPVYLKCTALAGCLTLLVRYVALREGARR